MSKSTGFAPPLSCVRPEKSSLYIPGDGILTPRIRGQVIPLLRVEFCRVVENEKPRSFFPGLPRHGAAYFGSKEKSCR
jgi:hypothetical protein